MIFIMDLDQTLIKDDFSIGEATIALFEKLKSEGHLIVFNSARSLDSMRRYVDLVKPNYKICNAGSQIYDYDDTLIYKKGIEPSTSKKIIEFLLESDVKEISLERDEGYFSNNYEYCQKVRRANFLDLKEANLDFTTYKILYPYDDSSLDEKIEKLGNVETSFYIGGKWHRISPSSKEEGNRKLKEILNLDTKLVVFGDDLGDIKMLEEADIGVAMKNSMPDVFKTIKIVSKYSNDEEGIYHFILEELDNYL